ncbi:hypothetical protein [Sorangium sp. So ce131]|uniref:hypothetical protein n=1 Tax=Sorangium sp. So ce131 TaxID=3133282 RepID=UPI003F5FE71A
MLDQKEIVRRIYLDLVNDPDWVARYLRDPRQTLRSYGIQPENEARLLHILALFCP